MEWNLKDYENEKFDIKPVFGDTHNKYNIFVISYYKDSNKILQ